VAFGVVCISGEDGAAAPEAAQLVAESLGFRLINEDIVAQAAAQAGVAPDAVADVERRKSALIKFLEGMGPAGMTAVGVTVLPDDVNQGPGSNELRALIRSVIEETASRGSVVIVAHAASLALASRDDVLRVLITASPETRRRRLTESLEIDDKEAGRMLKRSDAGRADYMKRFYGIGGERPTHYDVVINTDRISSDEAARLIVTAANGAV
jgi:cytidylate kinase